LFFARSNPPEKYRDCFAAKKQERRLAMTCGKLIIYSLLGKEFSPEFYEMAAVWVKAVFVSFMVAGGKGKILPI